MSREVDERVVELQFDNKQFESGVAQTIKSLDNLSNALKFEGISGSIRALQNGVNNLDFAPIANGVSALENTLTSLAGRIKLEVFDRLAKYAVDTGEKIFKALTTQGARAGFAEYETQQGAVQTILANTQHLGTTVSDVTAALDNLNEYADLTIYNFTQMTKNIGTFTAAGLDLETSTSAIKGIANLAAISGSTSEQASRAMYQLSQALAAGRVNLMDWNSVVNAGMGGKVFQDALKRTAKHMGIVIDESKSFRESISGGDTWLSAEVLSETLKQLSGDMDEATLRAQGWTDSEIKEIQKMAKTALDAATVVKTFSQLMDTVSEQIGSGWTKTWQLIFGDFEESKALWTGVYKAISPYIDAFSDLRNSYFQFWKENEGRERIIEAFSNLWSGASDFIDRFTASFRKAFPIVDTFGQTLTDISDRFLKFSERFKVVKEKTEQVTEAFENVSDAIGKITAEDKKNALDIWNWGNINGNPGRIDGQARVEALGESYDRVQKYINTFIATGYDVAKTDELLGVGAEKANEAISDTADISTKATTEEEKRDIVLTNLVKTLRNLADVAKIIGGSVLKTVKAASAAFKDVSDPLMASSDLDKTTSVLAKVAGAFEITAEKAEDVKRIFRGVFAAFDIVYQLIRAIASAVTKALVPSLDSVDNASGGLLTVLGNFGDWVYSLDQAIKEGDLFSIAIETMISFIASLGDKIRDTVKAFEDWSGIDFGKITSKITGAITKGLNKFKEWTGVDIAAIFKSIWERIKTFIGYLKAGDFSGAFNYVVEGIKGFVSSMIELIKGLDFKEILGKIGSAFGDIGEWLGELFDHAFGGAKDTAGKAVENAKDSFSLLDVLGAIAYGGYLLIKNAIGFLYGIITSPTAEQLGKAIKRFFEGLFNKTSEDAASQKTGMEKFTSFMENLGKALSDFYEKIKPMIGAGMIGGLLKIFSDLSTASKNFSKAPLVLNKSIRKLAEGFGDMTKAFKVETMSRFVKTLADSIIKLVIAIAAIMILDKMEGGVAGATAVITTLLVELIGALTFAQKKLDSEIDMMFLSKMLSSIGTTMIKMAAALFIISKIEDNEKIGGALFAFTGIMSELAGFIYIVSDISKGKQFRRSGEAMLSIIALMNQLGKTVIVMSIAMLLLSKVENMPKALEGLVGIFAVLVLLVTLVTGLAKDIGEGKKDEIAAIAATFVAIAGAFALIVPAVNLLGQLPEEALDRALWGVTAIAAIFAGLMVASETFSKGGTNSKAILAAGAAMIMVAAAMDIIWPSIIALSLMKPEQLVTGVIAFIAVLSMLAVAILGVTGVGGAAIAAGVGLALLAAAIAIITPSILAFGAAAYPIIKAVIKQVDKMKDNKVSSIAKKLLVLSGVLSVVGLALVIFGAGLTVVAAALVIVGVATLLMTPFVAALGNLIQALTAAAKIWPVIQMMLGQLGTTLGNAFKSFMVIIINGAGEIAEAVKNAAPKIAEAVIVVIDSILKAIWGWIPTAVESFLQMLDLIFDALVEYTPSLLLKIGELVTIFLTWLNDNSVTWADLITQIIFGVLIGVINGLTARVDELVNAIFDFIIALNNAIANALNTKGDKVVSSIYKMVVAFLNLLLRTLKKVEKKIEKIGGDFIDYVVTGVKNATNKLVERAKKLFTEDIPAGIKEIWSDLKDIGASFITAAIEGIEGGALELVESVKNLGKDALNALTGKDTWDENSPSAATYDAGAYFAEGAANGIFDGSDGVSEEAGLLGENALDAFAKNFDDDFNMDFTPTLNITPEANIDMRNVENGIASYDLGLGDDIFGGTDFAQSFDLSALLGGVNADLDAQRHEDTEANNALLQALNDHISDLVDRLENGMINIPENATFKVPVTIDGQTVANATAPYLDVINGEKFDLESAGVTSR